ncbi:MAG: flavin reductase [Acidimicrobiia bacterium]|nr:MAG: flavin reductase [Acidimicrobiia bacterium]
MIDRNLKRALGQMTYGAYVVAATHEGTTRAFTSTWTFQLSFAEPVIGVSISPKHDTTPLIDATDRFTVSLLAGDQVEQGQYFSYPGRRFRHVGDYLTDVEGHPVVDGCVAWLGCRVLGRVPIRDHVLYVAEVDAYGEGRIKQPALTYSSRKGWRIADSPARQPGESIRDKLLAMLEEE